MGPFLPGEGLVQRPPVAGDQQGGVGGRSPVQAAQGVAVGDFLPGAEVHGD